MKSRILTNLKNRYIIFILILIVVIVLVYFLMASRAFIDNEVISDENSTVSFSSCANIMFESTEEYINLTNAYPVSDNVGLSSMPTYEFTISNECEESQDVTVFLVSNSETTASASDIKINFEDDIKKLSSYIKATFSEDYEFQYTQSTENEISDIYTLGTYTLEQGESKTLNLQLWVNSTSSLENVTFDSTVVTAIKNDNISENYTLSQQILLDNGGEENSTSILDDAETSTDAGMYSAIDINGGPTYFYNFLDTDLDTNTNWVYFAGYYWRIMRIDEYGNVKLIYAGEEVVTEDDGITSTADQSIGNYIFNDYNLEDGVTYEAVGYVYTKGELHGTDTDSVIKQTVDNWYEVNIEDKGYSEYVATTNYCINRDAYIAESISDWADGNFKYISEYEYHDAFFILYGWLSILSIGILSGEEILASMFACNPLDVVKLDVGLPNIEEILIIEGDLGEFEYWTLSPYVGYNDTTMSPSYEMMVSFGDITEEH